MNVIIGAGISGLSFVNFSNDEEYLILEADPEIGGYCKTIKKDGFTWDYSGHFFHFRNKWIEDYVCRNIDPAGLIKCQKRSQIYYKSRYIDFPFQKNIHQLEKDEFIECLYDLFFTSNSGYSSFKQMLYSKFGKAIAEKFLIPYNEKLYACDLDLLDVNAMGRFFPFADKEEIIKNFRNAENSSYNSYFTYPREGAIQYIKSLNSCVDQEKICLSEPVISVDVKNKVVITSKRSIKFDNLISTMPFPKLLECCKLKYDKNVYSWNKVLVFNLGFDKKGSDTINNWVYFSDKDVIFYRVGYYDNIFSDRKMSLYVELGFNKDNCYLDESYYLEKVLEDLSKVGIITDHKLVSYHSIVMDPAYVHITDQSNEDVRNFKQSLSSSGIYSIGRYGSWTYCSIEDNIIEARELALRLNS